MTHLSIGERIRALRTEQGLTQKQLGERCGMSDAEIRKFESDRGSPTVRSLQCIADALGSSVAFLVDELGASCEATIVEKKWNDPEAVMREEKRQALKQELLALLEDEDVKMAVERLFMDLLSRSFGGNDFNY